MSWVRSSHLVLAASLASCAVLATATVAWAGRVLNSFLLLLLGPRLPLLHGYGHICELTLALYVVCEVLFDGGLLLEAELGKLLKRTLNISGLSEPISVVLNERDAPFIH